MSNTTDSEGGTDTSDSVDRPLPEGVPMVAFAMHLPGVSNVVPSPDQLPALVGIRPRTGGNVSYYRQVAPGPGMFPGPMVCPPVAVPGVPGGNVVAAAPLVHASPTFPQQPGEPPLPESAPGQSPEKSNAGETLTSPVNASPVAQSTCSEAPGVSVGGATAAAPLVQASQATPQPPVEPGLTGNSPESRSTSGNLTCTGSVSVLGATGEIQAVAPSSASSERLAPVQAESRADHVETEMEVGPVVEPSGPSQIANPLGSARAGMSGVRPQEAEVDGSPVSPRMTVEDRLRSLAIGRGSARTKVGGNPLASAIPAGAESELREGLELMDSSMPASDRPTSSEASAGGSYKRKKGKTPERKKRQRELRKDIRKGLVPVATLRCPVCTTGPGTDNHRDYSFCRHIMSCLMYQMYLCPVRGCQSVLKRADYLQTHLNSFKHGHVTLKEGSKGAFLDRCRFTVDPDENTKRVRVLPPSPDYKDCLNSLASTQQWLRGHAGRSALDVVLGWEGTKTKLAREAEAFTLEDPEVWETSPGPAPARPTVPRDEARADPVSSLGVKMEVEEEAEAVEEEASPSSSTGSVEEAPPPKRSCPNPPLKDPREVVQGVQSGQQVPQAPSSRGGVVLREARRGAARPLRDFERPPNFSITPEQARTTPRGDLTPTSRGLRDKTRQHLGELPPGHHTMKDAVAAWMDQARTEVEDRSVLQKLKAYIAQRVESGSAPPPAVFTQPSTLRSTARPRSRAREASGLREKRDGTPRPSPTSRPSKYGLFREAQVVLQRCPSVSGAAWRREGPVTRSSSRTSADPGARPLARPVPPLAVQPTKVAPGQTAAPLPPVPLQGQRSTVLQASQGSGTFERVVSGAVAGADFPAGTRDYRLRDTPVAVSHVNFSGFAVPVPSTELPVPATATQQAPSSERAAGGFIRVAQEMAAGMERHQPTPGDENWKFGGQNDLEQPAVEEGPSERSSESNFGLEGAGLASPAATSTSETVGPQRVNTPSSLPSTPVLPPDVCVGLVRSMVWEGDVPVGAHMVVTFRDQQGLRVFFGETATPVHVKLTGVVPGPDEVQDSLALIGRLPSPGETQAGQLVPGVQDPAPRGIPGTATTRPESSPEASVPGAAPVAMETDSPQGESPSVSQQVRPGDGVLLTSEPQGSRPLSDPREEDVEMGQESGAGSSASLTVTAQDTPTLQPGSSLCGVSGQYEDASPVTIPEELSGSLALDLSPAVSADEAVDSLPSPLCQRDGPQPSSGTGEVSPARGVGTPPEGEDADSSEQENTHL